MPKQNTARINIPVSQTMLEQLDLWWRKSTALRSRADAVRHIIKAATKKQPN